MGYSRIGNCLSGFPITSKKIIAFETVKFNVAGKCK